MLKRIVGVGLLASVIVLAGCQKPPQAELDAVKQAATEAAAAQPGEYAPEAWQQADEAIAAMDAEVAAQAEKFALTRSYKQTSELAAAAAAAVATARDEATQTKQRIATETAEAQQAVRAALESSQTLITELGQCKKKPKGFATDLEALSGQLTALTGQADEVDALIASDQLIDAQTIADGVLTQAEALAADLQNAKTRLGC